jgi:hypothetical protein
MQIELRPYQKNIIGALRDSMRQKKDVLSYALLRKQALEKQLCLHT